MKSSKIILASNSPRRKELLSKIIPEDKFITIGSNIREKILRGEDAEKYCLRIAEAKARNVIKRYKNRISGVQVVIGADTIISLNNEIIGQPKDKADAQIILKKLSGKCHEVLTGVAIVLVNQECTIRFCVRSKVWLKRLSKKAIMDYVESSEPMDKAGAYAIQGIGKKLVKKFNGSYTNIIGLPVQELRAALSSILGVRLIP